MVPIGSVQRTIHFLISLGAYQAKGDQEKTMGNIGAQRQNIDSMTGTSGQQAQDRRNELIPQQQKQLQDATAGYKNFAATGGVAPTTTAQLTSGYGNLANTGGMDISGDRSTYGRLQSGDPTTSGIVNSLQGFGSPTGDNYAGVNDTIGQLKNFSSTGGVSADQKANLYNPLYKNLVDTGGFTDSQQADIKAESNSVIPSYYSSLQDQLGRQRATSGYGAGFSEANQAMARQGAVDSGNQALNTRVNLANTILQNKLTGANALASNTLGELNATTGAKEKALSDAGSTGLGVTGQNISALSKAGDLNQQQLELELAAANGDVNAQSQLRSGTLAGLGGLSDTAKMTQSGMATGNAGLADLYGSSTNQLNQEEQNYLTSNNQNIQGNNSNLANQGQVAAQPGAFQTGFNNVIGGAGAVAGAITGLGGIKKQVQDGV